MALEGLPEHLKSRRTAEAVMSPAAIVAAGAGASVAILAGMPLLACAALGGVAYGIVVALELPRRPKPLKGIDPKALSQPWAQYVHEALAGAAAASTTVVRTRRARADPRPPGRDRRADRRAVQECWRVARHGDALDDGVQSLEPEGRLVHSSTRSAARDPNRPARPSRSTARSKRWRRSSRPGSGSPQVAQDARQRLEVLDARMDEAVARAVELSLSAGDAAELSGLGADVDQLVDDMEALRQGLEEVGTRPARGTSPLRSLGLARMFKALRRWWKYMTAKLSGSLEERADPKVQLEQAIQEAQEQHRRLTEQAANVIAHQKQTQMRLDRAQDELDKVTGNARQALLLTDEATTKGDTAKALEYQQAAESFANRLIALEHEVEGLKTMLLDATQNADAAKSAVQKNSSALQKKLSERQRLLSQLDQAKMQEQMNKAMSQLTATVGEDVPTFEEIREKIESRTARAQGMADLQGSSVESRMMEVEQAQINAEAQARLSQLRTQLGLPAPASEAAPPRPRPSPRSSPPSSLHQATNRPDLLYALR